MKNIISTTTMLMITKPERVAILTEDFLSIKSKRPFDILVSQGDVTN